jgi:hypothetical protein
MSKLYILSDITRKIGKKNHTWIYELTWLDPDNLDVYTMIVDESYRNYDKWADIIEQESLGIYSNLRRRSGTDKDNLPIMDADSSARMEQLLTHDEIIMYIEAKQERLA